MSKISQGRRHFLVGAGGVTLALPILPSLLSRTEAASLGQPKRFISMVHRYGHNPSSFFPGGRSGRIDLLADTKVNDHTYYKKLVDIPGNMSAVFDARFDKFRSKMNIYLGLDQCGPAAHNTTVPLSASSALADGEDNGPQANSRSVDCILENSRIVYPNLPRFKALRVSTSYYGTYGASWDRDSAGAPLRVPHIEGDQEFFKYVFADSIGGNNSDAVQAGMKHRLIVDQVLEHYKQVMRNPRLGSFDKQRLEQHITMVDEHQRRVASTSGSCTLPTLRTYTGKEGKEVMWRNMIDTAVNAMACDLTRISNFYVLEHLFGEQQNYQDSHQNSHDRQGGGEGERIGMEYSQFKIDQMLYLLERLSTTLDADGSTMLDNSVVLFTQDMSNGGVHFAQSLPCATFGGLGGKIENGYFFDFRQRPLHWIANREDFVCSLGQPYNRLLVSIMRAMGIPDSDFMNYGDGGGYGTFQDNQEYIQGMYAKFQAERNSTLPIVFKV